MSVEVEVARKWLAPAGGWLDGVIAKRTRIPYQPGTNKAMLKVKPRRTVDLVVGGMIYSAGGTAVSHILLGL